MRRLMAILALLVGCRAEDASPAPAAIRDPMSVVFASQCRFSNGARVILSFEVGKDFYTFIVIRDRIADESTIKRGERSNLEIETNGGVGKMTAIEELVGWLLTRPFRAFDRMQVKSELQQAGDIPPCPGAYPFSP